MKTNVGSFDGAARFIAGCTILFFGGHGLGWWALLGLIPLLTSAFNFCPLYWVLRIDTAAWEERFEKRHPHPPSDFDPSM